MKIYFYKLKKGYRCFDFDYFKYMKTIEIGLYFYNLIITWGKLSGEEHEDFNDLCHPEEYCRPDNGENI